MTLRADGTAECADCGLPMFPISESADDVTLECANRHRLVSDLPADRATRALIDNWIAKKGAQLHVQHERWEREEDAELNARLVKVSERRRQTGQTSGMTREEAFQTDTTWAGVAHTAPRALSGWHHHGEHESVIYVLSGRIRIECGPGGTTVLDGGPGDFLLIPAREVHREGNPTDEKSEIVVVRAGQGEVVVNVEGPA